jgi:hypothetical protein
MGSSTGSGSNFSVGPHFVSNFASINDLPQVTDIANMGFDIFSMFWFGFLATIMDAKLQDFAKKMTFVADVQQALSDVSTSFETIKQWTSFKDSLMNSVNVDNLSKAFFSLVRFKAMLSASYMKVDGNPFGRTMVYNTAKSVGIGRWLVTPSGAQQSPALGVPNALKDTTLANKIEQLLADLKNTNRTETSTQKYTNVAAYNGNLVSLLLKSDPFLHTPSAASFSNQWSSSTRASQSAIVGDPIKGLATQYISFSNQENTFATPATSSILSDTSTDASTGVTAAQSLSGTTTIKLDQFEQVENMYNNIRSQIQQSIAQRNLLVIKNSGSAG